MQKLLKALPWVVCLAVVVLPLVTLAVDIPVPTIISPDEPVKLSDVEGLIRGIARWLVMIAIIIAVIFIVIGGIMWMAARDNAEAAGKARKTIVNGIIGAAVVLAVGVILETLAAIITRRFF